MFVIEINGVDSSRHTLEQDAVIQKQRFIDNGIDINIIVITEKNSFDPPQE